MIITQERVIIDSDHLILNIFFFLYSLTATIFFCHRYPLVLMDVSERTPGVNLKNNVVMGNAFQSRKQIDTMKKLFFKGISTYHNNN